MPSSSLLADVTRRLAAIAADASASGLDGHGVLAAIAKRYGHSVPASGSRRDLDEIAADVADVADTCLLAGGEGPVLAEALRAAIDPTRPAVVLPGSTAADSPADEPADVGASSDDEDYDDEDYDDEEFDLIERDLVATLTSDVPLTGHDEQVRSGLAVALSVLGHVELGATSHAAAADGTHQLRVPVSVTETADAEVALGLLVGGGIVSSGVVELDGGRRAVYTLTDEADQDSGPDGEDGPVPAPRTLAERIVQLDAAADARAEDEDGYEDGYGDDAPFDGVHFDLVVTREDGGAVTAEVLDAVRVQAEPSLELLGHRTLLGLTAGLPGRISYRIDTPGRIRLAHLAERMVGGAGRGQIGDAVVTAKLEVVHA